MSNGEMNQDKMKYHYNFHNAQLCCLLTFTRFLTH